MADGNMAAVRPPLVRQRRDVTPILPYSCDARIWTRSCLPAGGQGFPDRVDPLLDLRHRLGEPLAPLALVPGDIATRGRL